MRREARRGNHYDALLLDPPRFGRGPNGQIWKLQDALPELLQACAKLLTPSPLFVLLNVYTTVLTQSRVEKDVEELRSYLAEMLRGFRLKMEAGEVALEDRAKRKVFTSAFARACSSY